MHRLFNQSRLYSLCHHINNAIPTAPPNIHSISTFIAPVLVAIAVCSPGLELAVPLELTPAVPVGVAPDDPAVTIATLVTVDFWPLGSVVVCTTRLVCDDAAALEVAAAEEDGLPEEDMVREPPPTVLTTVTPAALTVVTTEPAERVLTAVAPAALVVVSRAPAVREAGADIGAPDVLAGAPEDDESAGVEVTVEGEPGLDEPAFVVAVLGLEFGPELLEVAGP